ncbi:MAG: Bax inhibitor-1/YccA family protein [Candidatus Gastranaerophilaceae bacterium]
MLIDFDFIETASKYMFPKEYEWTGALGLLVTIVWLYVEILRLLARFQNRN